MNVVTASNAVELEGVTKRFGEHMAVDHLDMAVPEGAPEVHARRALVRPRSPNLAARLQRNEV